MVSENTKIFEKYSEGYTCFENIQKCTFIFLKASLVKIFNDAAQQIKVLSYEIGDDPQGKI